MKVFRDINKLPRFDNAVITIGSFDGLHRGHQKILARLQQLALEVSGESVLVTFDPHPRKIIFPKDKSLRLLNTIDEKLALCEKFGVDNVVLVPFSVEFSQQSPTEYIEDFLVRSFDPKYIVIGYDHRFGLNRMGDVFLLREHSHKHGFDIIEIVKQEVEDIAISSSKTRDALQKGNVRRAQSYLGYNYHLSGRVIHGDKIGASIGFPTANVQLASTDKLIPKDGVYAVRCSISGLPVDGMMYIGRRPTVRDDQKHKSVEVNLFDFDDDIYGEDIHIDLISHIRDGEKFDSLHKLKLQLQIDQEASLKVLAKLSSKPSAVRDQVCIAILNWNGQEYLESFLPQVLHSASSPIKIAVIDNASTDGSVQYLKEWHPEVEVVELTTNYGFAEGYNRGLQQLEAKYFVLLNSDVLVTENWLDPILAAMDADKNLAATQPKILSLEEKTHFEHAGAAGGYVDALGYPYCRGRLMDHTEEDQGQYDDAVDIDWATGAAMIVRSDVYQNFLGLDKDYFAHMEEIDLCWRIRRAGYSIKVIPESTIYHLGGGTLDYINPRKIYLNFRNNLATLLKNESVGKLLWLFPLRLVLDGVAGLKYTLSGNGKAMVAIIRAHFTVYGTFGHILRKRAVYNNIIAKYKVGDAVPSRSKVKSILANYYLLGKKRYQDL